MPAYNAETYIADAIRSVMAQTYKDWELIVVDDGSTDNTANIVKEIKLRDNRIKYVYQQNKRLSAARNTGIINSKGSWIAFLDSDDLWKPEKLQKQIEVALQTTDVDVIYSDGYTFDDDDLTSLKYYLIKLGRFTGEEMYKLEFENNYIPVLSAVVRKSFIDKVGWQDETLNACEDWDYWLRMSRAGAKFFGMPEKLFYYRRHGKSMSADTLLMDLAKATILLKNFEKVRFSPLETRKIFKTLIIPLFVTLIKKNQLKEATVLMEGVVQTIPSFVYNISYSLFKTFNKHSVFPIRAINKIDTLIHGS
jgi:glycosyltransferase involved in cell wall biosynthesis